MLLLYVPGKAGGGWTSAIILAGLLLINITVKLEAKAMVTQHFQRSGIIHQADSWTFAAFFSSDALETGCAQPQGGGGLDKPISSPGGGVSGPPRWHDPPGHLCLLRDRGRSRGHEPRCGVHPRRGHLVRRVRLPGESARLRVQPTSARGVRGALRSEAHRAAARPKRRPLGMRRSSTL